MAETQYSIFKLKESMKFFSQALSIYRPSTESEHRRNFGRERGPRDTEKSW